MQENIDNITLNIKELNGGSVIFSGFSDDNLKKELENKGLLFTTSITNKTNFIIVQELPENIFKSSAKIKFAIANKIPIYLKTHIENLVSR